MMHSKALVKKREKNLFFNQIDERDNQDKAGINKIEMKAINTQKIMKQRVCSLKKK